MESDVKLLENSEAPIRFWLHGGKNNDIDDQIFIKIPRTVIFSNKPRWRNW